MFVKNAIVNMDWEVEGFFESKRDDTFVAAAQEYETSSGTVCVFFKNGKSFLLYDDTTGAPMTREAFTELLHNLLDQYGPDFSFDEIPETCDSFIELSEGGPVDVDVAEAYNLDEYACQDIENRVDDLAGYISVEYTEM